MKDSLQLIYLKEAHLQDPYVPIISLQLLAMTPFKVLGAITSLFISLAFSSPQSGSKPFAELNVTGNDNVM